MSTCTPPSVTHESELADWERTDDSRAGGGTTYVSPAGAYRLTIEPDNTTEGHLVRLYAHAGSENRLLRQARVEHSELVLTVAAEMVSQRDRLSDVDTGSTSAADECESPKLVPADWDEETGWQAALENAFARAGVPRSEGTITRKEIDGRAYYYLAYREGGRRKYQYVAPVPPNWPRGTPR